MKSRQQQQITVPIHCQSIKLAQQFGKKQNIRPVIGYDEISLKQHLLFKEKQKKQIPGLSTDLKNEVNRKQIVKMQRFWHTSHLNSRAPKTFLYSHKNLQLDKYYF